MRVSAYCTECGKPIQMPVHPMLGDDASPPQIVAYLCDVCHAPNRSRRDVRNQVRARLRNRTICIRDAKRRAALNTRSST